MSAGEGGGEAKEGERGSCRRDMPRTEIAPRRRHHRVDGSLYREDTGRVFLWKRGKKWCFKHRRRFDSCLMCAKRFPDSFCEHLVPRRNCRKSHTSAASPRKLTPLVGLCLAASTADMPKHVCGDLYGFVRRRRCLECEEVLALFAQT